MSGGQWQAPPGWQRIRQQVFATYGRRCWRCGAYATTVDHVRPVVLGGTHDLANLRPCCSRRCSVRASRAGVAGFRCIEPQAAGDAVESATMAELEWRPGG